MRDYKLLYNNADFVSKGSEDVATESTQNCRFRQLQWATFWLLTVRVYPYSNFCVGLRKMYFETKCVTAVQGHPRSLISVPIERAYATSYY